jgi:hypothetical protein
MSEQPKRSAPKFIVVRMDNVTDPSWEEGIGETVILEDAYVTIVAVLNDWPPQLIPK